MTPDEKAKLEYEQVGSVFALLTDVRFKLLALVPTVSGAAVALLTSADIRRADQCVLASLGFVVTLGILFYEQRNTQLYNNVIGRLQHLEGTLDLSVATNDLVADCSPPANASLATCLVSSRCGMTVASRSSMPLSLVPGRSRRYRL